MGFGLGDLWLVQRLKTQGLLPDPFAVAEIGAQQVDVSILENSAELVALGDALGIKSPLPALALTTSDGSHALAGAPMTREIWQWLGVDYLAIDIDGTPGAIALDLNCDVVPAAVRSKYGLVTNFGTTEHVANQANAFKIIHDLTAVGGIMIHNLPCHLPNHGLINYNPKFFWALARANDYRQVYLRINPEVDPDSIHIALQKQHDFEFVTPLDVANTAAADDPVMKQRYWTVFDKEAIDAITASNDAQLMRRAIARRFPWLVALKRRILP
jgi:hypothetical protein